MGCHYFVLNISYQILRYPIRYEPCNIQPVWYEPCNISCPIRRHSMDTMSKILSRVQPKTKYFPKNIVSPKASLVCWKWIFCFSICRMKSISHVWFALTCSKYSNLLLLLTKSCNAHCKLKTCCKFFATKNVVTTPPSQNFIYNVPPQNWLFIITICYIS